QSMPAAAGLRLVVVPDLNASREACRQIRAFLTEQGIPAEDAAGWELALTEAANNVVEHGNKDELGVEFEISAVVDRDWVEVRVLDRTEGFDYPEHVELPDPVSEGGRGLFLIESICDSVSYMKGKRQNCLLMRSRSEGVDTASWTRPDPAVKKLQTEVVALEETLDGMTEELSSSYESLAAIFKFSRELSRQRDLNEFARLIFDHLLKITESESYLLRLKKGDRLVPFVASDEHLEYPDLDLTEEAPGWFELDAARTRQDVWIESPEAARGDASLGAFSDTKTGIIHPFYLSEDLIGTLALGKSVDGKHFSAGHVNVLHTFCDFLALQILNARYQDENIKSKVVSRELEIAKNIQRSLLPETLPDVSGVSLAGYYESALHVGGDFYDVFETPDGGILMCMADVMGKGVPAAMFSVIIRTVLRAQKELGALPSALLAKANQILYADLDRVDMFITAQLVYLNPTERIAATASAGHCPLLVGNHLTGKFMSIEADGPPLGIIEDMEYAGTQFELDPGTHILMYTDGITEAKNRAGEMWNDERLDKWWRQAIADLPDAAAIKESLIQSVAAFVDRAPATDDLTFLLMADNKENTQ
ncbi:MAG: serine phosphatase RsbU (regulator of sigma subunit)/anti-sigma regulatory factor (Ser/Thr protein kinase), partial [Limisphaerales bacterium]